MKPLLTFLPAQRLLLMALISAVFFASGCEKAKPEAKKNPPRTVTAATVEAKDVPLYYNTLGRATSLEAVDIVSQVNGQIMKIHFTQGAMVKKGDLLYTIYQGPYEAAVTEARGLLTQSIASLEIAKLAVDRNRPLVPEKLVSEQDFEQLEANVIELEGQVEQRTGALEAAQINLNFCSITAPVDGMIGIYYVNEGNVVYAAGSTTLTTIQQISPIYVDFIVPTTEFPKVLQYFDKHDGKLTIEVGYLDNSDSTKQAELTIIGNEIAENTGTVSLRAITPNKERTFWPNQPLSTRIILETLEGALVVPNGAVAIGQQGTYAFVIKDDNTVEQRSVTVGQTQAGGLTVVEKGLKKGERVVVDGQVFLMPGQEVIVTEMNNTKEKARLPKSMTDGVIALLKKHDKGSPEVFAQIEKTGQLPVKLLENLKKHGKLSAKEVAFIEQLEGYGDAGQGAKPADTTKDASAK